MVVLPAGSEWDGAPVEAVAIGGATRAESVRAALRCIPHDVAIVVVHDAAHPLATTALVDAVVAAVRAGADGAVPVIPASETVARLDADVVIETTPASRVALLQMPHAFRADVLRAAHERGVDAADDASLLCALGRTVVAVPGDPRNLHVTTREDAALARTLLSP